MDNRNECAVHHRYHCRCQIYIHIRYDTRQIYINKCIVIEISECTGPDDGWCMSVCGGVEARSQQVQSKGEYANCAGRVKTAGEHCFLSKIQPSGTRRIDESNISIAVCQGNQPKMPNMFKSLPNIIKSWLGAQPNETTIQCMANFYCVGCRHDASVGLDLHS